jgi:hypothetical protein
VLRFEEATSFARLATLVAQRRSRHLKQTACRHPAPRDHAPGHTQLAADERARLPVFCGDFLHDLDFEITVDRILKGEKPADLPVQTPTKHALVITLGLEVLARADAAIE